MHRKELYLNDKLIGIAWGPSGHTITTANEKQVYSLPAGNKIKIVLVDETTNEKQVFNHNISEQL